jgi:hypothetical protein
MRDTLDQLASEVSAARLSRPEVEGLLYRLSGQQRRLFLRLCSGPADTIALRSECSIGNVSQAALELNAKLAAADDPRRVVCTLAPHRNQYGEAGSIGNWRLIERVSNDRAAA